MKQPLHTPVMVDEVINYLDPHPDQKFLDCTVGYGGHTLAILAKGAKVTGIDQDVDMLEAAQARIAEAGYSNRFIAIRSSFSSALEGERLPLSHYAGVLFDLGVSSYQLDTPKRGFSFRFEAPLDMRMNPDLAVTAKDLINGLGKKELVLLFHTLGEEKAALKLAEKIVDARKIMPITTTTALASLIAKTIPSTGKIHPATKVFQALRMAVNSERDELKSALPQAINHLSGDGILAVLTFHSLEDAIVTDFFAHHPTLARLTPAPLTPSVAEVRRNPRSRSAKLYVAQKGKL